MRTVVNKDLVFQSLVDGKIKAHVGYDADDARNPAPPECCQALLHQKHDSEHCFVFIAFSTLLLTSTQ